MKTVGLLGLQGAFLDHIPLLRRCGAGPQVVRSPGDLAAVDRLIIPGGESTVMTKFLSEFGLLSPLRQRIDQGMPVWGICAGCILLADRIDSTSGPLRVLAIHVTRNAYGRQIASRQAAVDIPVLAKKAFPAIFIRAPRIEDPAPDVTIQAQWGEDPVFVQHRQVMATTFHPELTNDAAFHDYFLNL